MKINFPTCVVMGLWFSVVLAMGAVSLGHANYVDQQSTTLLSGQDFGSYQLDSNRTLVVRVQRSALEDRSEEGVVTQVSLMAVEGKREKKVRDIECMLLKGTAYCEISVIRVSDGILVFVTKEAEGTQYILLSPGGPNLVVTQFWQEKLLEDTEAVQYPAWIPGTPPGAARSSKASFEGSSTTLFDLIDDSGLPAHRMKEGVALTIMLAATAQNRSDRNAGREKLTLQADGKSIADFACWIAGGQSDPCFVTAVNVTDGTLVRFHAGGGKIVLVSAQSGRTQVTRWVEYNDIDDLVLPTWIPDGEWPGAAADGDTLARGNRNSIQAGSSMSLASSADTKTMEMRPQGKKVIAPPFLQPTLLRPSKQTNEQSGLSSMAVMDAWVIASGATRCLKREPRELVCFGSKWAISASGDPITRVEIKFEQEGSSDGFFAFASFLKKYLSDEERKKVLGLFVEASKEVIAAERKGTKPRVSERKVTLSATSVKLYTLPTSWLFNISMPDSAQQAAVD